MLKKLYEEIKNNPGKKVKNLQSYKETLNEIVKEYNSLVEEIEKKFPKLKGIFEKITNPEDIYGYEGVFDSLPDLSKYYEKYLNLTSYLDLLFEMEDLTTDEVFVPEI